MKLIFNLYRINTEVILQKQKTIMMEETDNLQNENRTGTHSRTGA